MIERDDILALAKWRMDKANEQLVLAKLALEQMKFSEVLVKSYYAVFHAEQALNAFIFQETKTHKGTLIAFSKNYIREGLISNEASGYIARLRRFRERADYEDFYVADEKTAKDALEKAESLFQQFKKVYEQRVKDLNI